MKFLREENNAYQYNGHTVIQTSSGYRIKDGKDSWIGGEFDTDVDAKEYIDGLKESFNDSSEYTYVASKSVLDSDGFYTDYTWYKSSDGLNVFVFGDSDLYRPDDGNFDWEEEDDEAAQEWFDSYSGYDDDFLEESATEDKPVELKLSGNMIEIPIEDKSEVGELGHPIQHGIGDPRRKREIPAQESTRRWAREGLTESPWEKGDSVTLWWSNPQWSETSPSFAACMYAGQRRDGKYRFISDTYGWTYLLDVDAMTITTPKGQTYPVFNDNGWLKAPIQEGWTAHGYTPVERTPLKDSMDDPKQWPDNKELTYDDACRLAMAYYSQGGDGFYETTERYQFDDEVKMFGPKTVGQMKRDFGVFDSVAKDRMTEAYNIQFYQVIKNPEKPTDNGKMIAQAGTEDEAKAKGNELVGKGNYLIKAVCDDGKVRDVDLHDYFNESKSINEDKSVDELQFKDTKFKELRRALFSTGDNFIVFIDEGTENGEIYYYISMNHPFDDSGRYVVEVGEWDNPESAVKAAKEATDLLNSESDAKEFKTSLGSQKFLVDSRKVYKRVAKRISSKKWLMAEEFLGRAYRNHVNESKSIKEANKLAYSNEKYKGYMIRQDHKYGGYNVYDKEDEMEDSGFRTIDKAKEFIDSLEKSKSIKEAKSSGWVLVYDNGDRDVYWTAYDKYTDNINDPKVMVYDSEEMALSDVTAAKRAYAELTDYEDAIFRPVPLSMLRKNESKSIKESKDLKEYYRGEDALDDVISWLQDRKQAWNDFTAHFSDVEDEDLTYDMVIDWISENETLYDDYLGFFGDEDESKSISEDANDRFSLPKSLSNDIEMQSHSITTNYVTELVDLSKRNGVTIETYDRFKSIFDQRGLQCNNYWWELYNSMMNESKSVNEDVEVLTAGKLTRLVKKITGLNTYKSHSTSIRGYRSPGEGSFGVTKEGFDSFRIIFYRNKDMQQKVKDELLSQGYEVYDMANDIVVKAAKNSNESINEERVALKEDQEGIEWSTWPSGNKTISHISPELTAKYFHTLSVDTPDEIVEYFIRQCKDGRSIDRIYSLLQTKTDNNWRGEKSEPYGGIDYSDATNSIKQEIIHIIKDDMSRWIARWKYTDRDMYNRWKHLEESIETLTEAFQMTVDLDMLASDVGILLDADVLGESNWIEVFPTGDSRPIGNNGYILPLEITGPNDDCRKATFTSRGSVVDVRFRNGSEAKCYDAKEIARFIAGEFGVALNESLS